jgi:hypothetical protein
VSHELVQPHPAQANARATTETTMAKTIRRFVPRILVSPIHGILYWFNHGLEGEGHRVIHD